MNEGVGQMRRKKVRGQVIVHRDILGILIIQEVQVEKRDRAQKPN